MFATLPRLSKASRRALTPKRGNKDYYKGTRQAMLPGGLRTGAPGHHVVRGKAKYRLDDTKVRVFVAPSVAELESSPLKPYVAPGVKVPYQLRKAVFGNLPLGHGQLTGEVVYSAALKAVAASSSPAPSDAAKVEAPKVEVPRAGAGDAAITKPAEV